MKKMNVLFAAFTLAIAAVTPITSSAADIADKSTKHELVLSKTYAPHYTLTIPDKPIDITEESVDVDVSVEGYLEYDKQLTVSVESANSWTLIDQNHEDNKNGVSYELKVGENVITDDSNEIMSVTPNDNNKAVSTALTFGNFGEAAYAGTYSDTLTFDVVYDTYTPPATTTTTPEETTEAAVTTTEAAPES